MSLLSRLAIDSSKLRGFFENRSISLFAFLACAFLFLPISHPLLAAPAATVTTLQITPNNITSFMAQTLTARVTANGVPVTSGQVVFCYAEVTFCEGTAVFGVAPILANGVAKIARYFPAELIQVYAAYQGTNTYAPSRSATDNIKVSDQLPTTTTLVASGSPGSYTLTATVVAPERKVIFGSVDFYASASNLKLGTASVGPSTRSYALAQQQTRTVAASSIFKLGYVTHASFPNVITLAPKPGGGGILSSLSTENPYFFGVTGTPYTTDYDLPGRPYDVAEEDVNLDGTDDYILLLGSDDPTDGSLSTVYILRSNPSTYSNYYSDGGSYTVGANANALLSADFNHDGYIDLAVSNAHDGTFGILFGDPANPGSFLPQQVHTSGDMPTAMVMGDFNGDGLPDLAFSYASSSSSHVSVFLNDPANPGQFLAPTIYALAAPARSLTTGDLNRDGMPDLAFAVGNSVGLLLTDTAHPGAFLPEKDYALPSSASSVALGDYTGNGLFDVAVLINGGNTIGILRQDENHAGALLPILNYSAGPAAPLSQLLAADLNFDGLTDLAEFSATNRLVGSDLISYTQTANAELQVSDVPGGYAHAYYTGFFYYGQSQSCVIPVNGSSGGPPRISNLAVTNISETAATISWTTNVPSQGSLNYGIGDLYGIVNWERLPVTNHSFTLSRLYPANTYDFQAKSVTFASGCTHSTVLSSVGQFATAIPAVAPTTATLILSPAGPVSAGDLVELAARIDTASGSPRPGKVKYCKNPGTACEGANLIAETMAGPVKVRFEPGLYSLYTIFEGNLGFDASTSPAKTLEVQGTLPSTTTLAKTGTGSQHTVTATVSVTGSQMPTGTVSFLADASHSTLATTTLSGASEASFGFTGPIATGFPSNTIVAGPVMQDFDRNGTMDMFFATNSGFLLLPGDPAQPGHFLAPTASPAGISATDFAFGDTNADGSADMVFAGTVLKDPTMQGLTTASSVRYLGGFIRTDQGALPLAAGTSSKVTMGDFNGDGLSDIAAGVAGNGNLFVLLTEIGTDGASLPMATYPFTSVNGLASKDFNGDGLEDIVGVDTSGGRASVLLADRAHPGKFLAQVNYSTDSNPQMVVVGDFNHDGHPDFATLNTNNGSKTTISILLADASHPGSFLPQTSYPFKQASKIFAADLNGDGFLDILSLENGTAILYGDPSQMGKFLPVSTISVPGVPSSGYTGTVGNLRGGGVADLLFYSNTQLLSLLSQNTLKVSTTPISLNTTANNSIVHANYEGNSSYDGSSSCSINLAYGTPSSPVISGVTVTNLSSTSATVSWTTNIPANGYVRYGLASVSENQTPWVGAPGTTHSLVLSGLTPGKTYSYQAGSVAFYNGCSHWTTVSATQTFTTPAM